MKLKAVNKDRIVARDGLLAYIFLAFIGSAGIFYISALPGIISALIDGYGFTVQQANYVASANAYGSMTGALIAVFMIKKIPWKLAVTGLFIAMIGFELLSTQITSPELMILWRYLTGVAGGCSVGFGLSLLARLKHMDRAFGFLMILQFGLGGLIIYLRQIVEPVLGDSGVFIMLAILIAISLSFVPFLNSYTQDSAQDIKPGFSFPTINKLTVMILLSIFFYQASANALWANIERIGLAIGIDSGDVSKNVAIATWMGIFGGLVPIIMGIKYGRLPFLVSGLLMTIVGVVVLYLSTGPTALLTGGVLINIAWSYALAYLFGLSAHYDESGQLAAAGGMASKFGLATGPLIAGTLLTNGNYTPIIVVTLVGLVVCLALLIAPSRQADGDSYDFHWVHST